jgi:hypothetical protein
MQNDHQRTTKATVTIPIPRRAPLGNISPVLRYEDGGAAPEIPLLLPKPKPIGNLAVVKPMPAFRHHPDPIRTPPMVEPEFKNLATITDRSKDNFATVPLLDDTHKHMTDGETMRVRKRYGLNQQSADNSLGVYKIRPGLWGWAVLQSGDAEAEIEPTNVATASGMLKFKSSAMFFLFSNFVKLVAGTGLFNTSVLMVEPTEHERDIMSRAEMKDTDKLTAFMSPKLMAGVQLSYSKLVNRWRGGNRPIFTKWDVMMDERTNGSFAAMVGEVLILQKQTSGQTWARAESASIIQYNIEVHLHNLAHTDMTANTRT